MAGSPAFGDRTAHPHDQRVDYYQDDGPDAAIWEHVLIGHPVGKDMTLVGNPAAPKSHLCKLLAAGQMLDHVNDIFRRVLLDPRKADFEAAIRQLHES